MSARKEVENGAGCLIAGGMVCAAIGVGSVYGWGCGFVTFGLIALFFGMAAS